MSASQAPAVELIGLRVALDGREVLGPVDLRLETGSHLLLVGRSGSGKTTLLRAVAGLVTPTAGEVRLFGQPASSAGRLLVAPAARGIGYLFQGGALWPHMTVRRTLDFVLSLSARASGRALPDRARRAQRSAELLALVELEGFERRRPATLSGGEAQRLALARALACEPRILLLDEPLGPLDAELRVELTERLARLSQELGLTTIHVTHDPHEARASATRLVRLVDGSLVEETPERTDPTRQEANG